MPAVVSFAVRFGRPPVCPSSKFSDREGTPGVLKIAGSPQNLMRSISSRVIRSPVRSYGLVV